MGTAGAINDFTFRAIGGTKVEILETKNPRLGRRGFGFDGSEASVWLELSLQSRFCAVLKDIVEYSGRWVETRLGQLIFCEEHIVEACAKFSIFFNLPGRRGCLIGLRFTVQELYQCVLYVAFFHRRREKYDLVCSEKNRL